MKPEWSPLPRREERREPRRQRGVHELLDAPLADVRELGDGDRREVERERERLAVEVAAADRDRPRQTSVEKTLGLSVTLLISRSRTCAHPRERVARRAVHLRHAAERVGVLHLAAVLWLSAISLSARSARRFFATTLARGAGAPPAGARRTGASSP
jgi:hypothetical protein